MSKYGEPWGSYDDEPHVLYDRDSDLIAKFEDDSGNPLGALAQRARACVNALAGKNPDALGRFVLQAKMALEVLEAGPESMRVGARALRKAMEDFGT